MGAYRTVKSLRTTCGLSHHSAQLSAEPTATLLSQLLLAHVYAGGCGGPAGQALAQAVAQATAAGRGAAIAEAIAQADATAAQEVRTRAAGCHSSFVGDQILHVCATS
jgi:hypothetical protein